MAQTRWVIGNWKQNKLRADAAALAIAVREGIAAAVGDSAVRVGLAPSLLALDAVRPYTGDSPAVPLLLAQDCAAQESGAFTGEVGPAMLREAGVAGVIVGHSERRTHFGDTDTLVAAKLRCALGGGLSAVLCVGETLVQRDTGDQENAVISQLSAAFSHVDPALLPRLVLAYEPVWAIGTGRTASPAQAGAMHAAIRGWLRAAFGAAGAGRSVLYGGSVNPGNAAELMAAQDVDGFLVGGASLDPTSFLAIVRATAEAHLR